MLTTYKVRLVCTILKCLFQVLAKLNMGEGVTQLCMDRKLYQKELSKSERAKQDKFLAAVSSSSSTSTSDQSSSIQMSENNEIASGKPENDPANGTKVKSTSSSDHLDRSVYIDTILEHLTPDDVRVLIRSEDELAQATHFSRIFPTQVHSSHNKIGHSFITKIKC